MNVPEQSLEGCSVLVVDDEPTILLSLRDSLRDAGAEVLTAESGNRADEIIDDRAFDVVVTDVRLPGLSGLDLLAHLRDAHLDTEVILITAHANVEQAVSAMKSGAYDYVVKPFPNEKIVRMVGHVWRTARLKRQVRELQTHGGLDSELSFLVGKSESWRAVIHRIKMVAPTDATVLIVGPSGTGKELVARALHLESRRAAGPFVRVHGAALPPTLMESELFGHVRGAFTGATRDARGRFERAAGGTLLLDEVDEIPLEVQVKLLRVLQERVIERVGSGEPVPVDVRLLAAAKGDLEALVASGRFRQDLLYRLSVVRLELPTLAERRSDIPLLAEHFLGVFSSQMARPSQGLTVEALGALMRYDYPGNVRELEHIIEAACAQSDGRPIGLELLPESVRQAARDTADHRVGFTAKPLADAMKDYERSYLEHALREFRGSRGDLAHVLGISRKGLWQKLKKHRLLTRGEGS